MSDKDKIIISDVGCDCTVHMSGDGLVVDRCVDHPGKEPLTVDESLFRIALSVNKIIFAPGDPNKVVEYAREIQPELAKIWLKLGLTQAHELTLELTRLLDEHPEGWEGPCECFECLNAE